MTWLERLKALRHEGSGLPSHRQNRQNPGFVSFDRPEEARIPSSEGADPEAAREAFEERAAIMEYDGGLSRTDAEQAARALVNRVGTATEAAPRRASEPLQAHPIPDEWGDMRPCDWCWNLTRSGRCMSAWRGEMRAARDYAPTFPGHPRRCYFYDPKPCDPDTREGCRRWPEMDWEVRQFST